ncbi:hypothetical protein [Rhodopirellula europaea]|uniref:hypothetical protein n=1 Tax=Rhodopirellula europaea TaxID=1263866 RepID=UPI00034A4F1B|nr:hypothetical protein [Rhodopirellula europaea]
MTEEQQAAIFQKACEDPAGSNRPIAKWTHRELAMQLIADGVVAAISDRWDCKLLGSAKIRPHKKQVLADKQRQTGPKR